MKETKYWAIIDRIAELCDIPEEDITDEEREELATLDNLADEHERQFFELDG